MNNCSIKPNWEWFEIDDIYYSKNIQKLLNDEEHKYLESKMPNFYAFHIDKDIYGDFCLLAWEKYWFSPEYPLSPGFSTAEECAEYIKYLIQKSKEINSESPKK